MNLFITVLKPTCYAMTNPPDCQDLLHVTERQTIANRWYLNSYKKLIAAVKLENSPAEKDHKL